MKPSLPIALTAALLIGSVSIVAAKSPARPAPKPASAAAAAAVKATPPAKTAGTAAAALLALKAHQIIKKMDTVMQGRSTISEIEMKIVTPHWRRTLRMKSWTKGLDLAFVRILSPRRERGVASLKRGTDMWNYFPRADMITRIPPSMMLGSWMGSDFTNDDLVKESTLTEDYAAELIDAGDGAGFRTLRLTAGEQTATVWPRIDLRVNADDWLPVEEIYFDEHGQPMRRILFSEVRAFGDRTVPATMELVPLHKEGHRTVIRYLEADFDVDLEDDVFSLRHLQSRR